MWCGNHIYVNCKGRAGIFVNRKDQFYTHICTHHHHEPLFCTLTLSSSHCRSLLQPRRRSLSYSFRLSLSLCLSLFIPLFLLVITFLRKVESQGEGPGSSLFEYVWFVSRGSNASQIAWVSLPSASEAVLAEPITSLITHALDLLRCLHSSLLSIFPPKLSACILLFIFRPIKFLADRKEPRCRWPGT
jgi:hypothetical protein